MVQIFVKVLHDILAIGEERIVESLRQKDITPKNAAKRRSLNLVDRVCKMVLSLVLFHGQLQLANCLFDLNLEDDVLCLLFSQSVIYL